MYLFITKYSTMLMNYNLKCIYISRNIHIDINELYFMFLFIYEIFNDVDEFILNVFIYQEIFISILMNLFLMFLFITKYSTMLMI